MKLRLDVLIVLFLLFSCEGKRKATDSLPPDPLKKDGLYHLRTTSRISSNLFSDFVTDKEGNMYLASFQQKEGALDRILILKISPLGKIIWEKGQMSTGRALAINKSPEGKLWVCGFFQGSLNWDGHEIESTTSAMFWARIDQNGKTEYLEKPRGEITAFNLHTNSQGEMLMAAQIGKRARLGGMEFNGQGESQNMLLLLDQEGNTKWGKPIQGNVQCMSSDQNGSFWVGGDFTEEFSFEQDRFQTSSPFDQDAFLTKISEEEIWSKQIGYKGFLRYGYRSNEGISDLTLGANNKMLALIKEDNPDTQDKMGDRFLSDIGLFSISDTGEIRQEEVISTSQVKGQIFRMSQSDNGELWISGKGMGNFSLLGDTIRSPGYQAFLIGLDQDRRSSKRILPSHGPNTDIRIMKHSGNQLYTSGHYTSYLKIAKDSIENRGTHALFFYRKYLPTF